MAERGAALATIADPNRWVKDVIISYACLLLWIGTSAAVIIYNKFILDTFGFPFPITLALLHMGCSASLAHFAVALGIVQKPDMPWDTYMRAVVPIGIVYSIILSLSNATYMFLSVSFIQMLKAITPAAVYTVGCIMGTEQWSYRLALNLLVVIVGIFISAYGEVQFVVVGVVAQLAAIVLESVRLTMTQLLLQRQGFRLNPVTALYYIAPCCFLGLLPLAFALEFDRMRTSAMRVHPVHLLYNSLAAFVLNVASFLLLGRTSALTMNLGGVVKDWLLIGLSASVFHSVVTPVNLGGYIIAFLGVSWYNLQKFWESTRAETAKAAQVETTPNSPPISLQSGRQPTGRHIQKLVMADEAGADEMVQE